MEQHRSSTARCWCGAIDQLLFKAELAAELSRLAGRPIAYQDLSEAEYRARWSFAGAPFDEWIAAWDRQAAEGVFADDGDRQMAKLIGRPTTDWRVPLKAAYERTVAAAANSGSSAAH